MALHDVLPNAVGGLRRGRSIRYSLEDRLMISAGVMVRIARNVIVAWVAMVFAGLPVHAQPAGLLELDGWLTELAETRGPSVVSIARLRPVANFQGSSELDPFAGSATRLQNETSDVWLTDIHPDEFGCGVVLKSTAEGEERLILTAFHLVRGGPIAGQNEQPGQSRLVVHFSNRHRCLAEIVAADSRSDLAVIRPQVAATETFLKDWPTLEWAETEVRRGQMIFVLGNPHAVARDGVASIAWGLLGNVARRPAATLADSRMAASQLAALGTLYQLDARLPAGMSGAAILNLEGKLIAIGSSLAALEGYDLSTGFGIPVNGDFQRIVTDLLAGQEVEYGLLGVQAASLSPGEFMTYKIPTSQPSAAVASFVVPGSAAQLAGIQTQDVILEIQEEAVFASPDVTRMVSLHPPETELSIKVWRPSRKDFVQLKAKLGKWPVAERDVMIATNRRYPSWRGLTVDYPTARAQFIPEPQRSFPAVLVVEVAENSPASEAKLQPGDYVSHVAGVAVKTPGEFQEAVQAESGETTLTLIDGRKISIQKGPDE